MNSFLRPGVYFVLTGFVIFIAGLFVNGTSKDESKRIVVDSIVEKSLLTKWDKVHGADADFEERDRVKEKKVAKYIREEILYREGLKRGLDKNDKTIRERVQKKMEMMAVEGARLEPILDGDIKKYYDKNRKDYMMEKKSSFRYIFFSKEKRAQGCKQSVNDVYEMVKSDKSARFEKLAALGDGSINHNPVKMQAAQGFRIERTFGAAFATQIQDAKKSGWLAPVETDDGYYIVEIQKIFPASQILFDKVKSRIRSKLKADQNDEQLEKFIKLVESNYQIVIEESI